MIYNISMRESLIYRILKKILSIAAKVLLRLIVGVVVMVYVTVAMLNYSLVQSTLGAVVGDYFSKEWGGELRIGSLHAMPFDHLILDNVLLVDPAGDTIFDAETLRVGFNHFPYSDYCLDLDHVYLRNVYYHMSTETHDINLKYIIDYFKSQRPRPKDDKVTKDFTVLCGTLELENIHYKMDLPDSRETIYPYGVQIPHMEYLNIHGKFRNVKVVRDDVTCRILRLCTRERSGFDVKNISGDVHVGRYDITVHDFRVETAGSLIMLADAQMKYDTWKGMKGYVSTVWHDAELREGTHVVMSEVAYWAPVLWGIDADVYAHGHATGTIDSMITDMRVRWGRESGAHVSGSVVGLPRIDTTTFNVELDDLHCTAVDLDGLLCWLPSHQDIRNFTDQIGHLHLDGTVRGNIRDGANARLQMMGAGWVAAGELTAHATREGYAFSMEEGQWSVKNGTWSIGKGTGKVTNGLWNTKEHGLRAFNGQVTARVEDLRYDDKQLATLDIEGLLEDGDATLHLGSHDSLSLFDIDLQAALSDSVKRVDGEVLIEKLEGVLPSPLATHITFLLQGHDLDNGTLDAAASRLQYGRFMVSDIALRCDVGGGEKEASITSSALNATVSGRFDYDEIPLMWRHLVDSYLPTSLAGRDRWAVDSTALACLDDNTLDFHITLKDAQSRPLQLTEALSVASGTHASGSYNLREQLKVVVRSDSVRLGTIKLSNFGASMRPWGSRYEVEAQFQTVSVGSTAVADRVNGTLALHHAGGSLGVRWGDVTTSSHGDLLVSLDGDALRVEKPLFYLRNTPWRLGLEGSHMGLGGQFTLQVDKLTLDSEGQHISGEVDFRGLSSDHVELSFAPFELATVSSVLGDRSILRLGGELQGRLSLYGIGSTPYMNANLTIDSCILNGQSLGRTKMKTGWNAELNILNAEVSTQGLTAMGWVGLGGEENEIDMNVDLDHFRLLFMRDLMTSFATHFDGAISGNVDLHGSLQHPEGEGEVILSGCTLTVAPTGVAYHCDDTLLLDGHLLDATNLVLRDERDNSLRLDGTVDIGNPDRIALDLNFTSDNLLILNRKGGENYGGEVYVAANGAVRGSLSEPHIEIQARTNKGSTLEVPVNSQKQVKTRDYITFVGDEYEGASEGDGIEESRNGERGLTLSLDLNITPDARIYLPMDFSEVELNVGASGEGALHLDLKSGDSPKVMGNYELTSGSMKVLLLSVYEKNFTISPGGTIHFQGNVPDTRFDIEATYSQRVNLSTLTGSLSTIDNTQKYLQVENIISLSGTVGDPHIGFDLRLPNADQSVEEEVFAYIDRNSERDMLNQTVSLLLGGSFYNANRENATGASNSDAIGAVTSFMGNRLTDMVQFVNVNIDYRSANEFTNEQLDVNISKDWGRWYLESTLGYGGDSRSLENTSAAGSTIIDALIGYRISPLVHLYAYNRTNTNDYTRIDLPYKQGAGIKLTKDFDRWTDLFIPKKKKKKDKK